MIPCKDYLKWRKKFKTSGAAKAHYNTFHETKEYVCERCGKILRFAHESTITKNDAVRTDS